MQFSLCVYVPHCLTNLPSVVYVLFTRSSQSISRAFSQDHDGFSLLSPSPPSPSMRALQRPPRKRPATSPSLSSSSSDDNFEPSGRTQSKPIDHGVDTMVGRDGMRALPDEILNKQLTKQQKERNSNLALCAKKLQLCWQAVCDKVVLHMKYYISHCAIN